MAININIISIHDGAYSQVFALRDEVLRKPLGLSLKDEDLSDDAKDIILIAEEDTIVVGCVMLHPISNEIIKLRQMAVYNEHQGKGIGKQLVTIAEEVARNNGYTTIVLHARVHAVGFYEKMGYTITSTVFTEVGIPHQIMKKNITV